MPDSKKETKKEAPVDPLHPDAGQLEVQEMFDAMEESGYWPPGGPPDTSHTVEEVVQREQDEKDARREEFEGTLKGK